MIVVMRSDFYTERRVCLVTSAFSTTSQRCNSITIADDSAMLSSADSTRAVGASAATDSVRDVVLYCCCALATAVVAVSALCKVP
eukprot:8426-Heterococcus_DN1.PRE.2